MSGGDAPFLAPSDSLSIADGEGWGEAALCRYPFLAPSDSLSIADGEGWGEAAPCQ